MSAAAATLLAFDFGTRNIGVAVGQTVTGTASPVGSVAVRRGAPDWEAIDALMERWRPDALIVGLPLNMDGTEQPVTALSRRFARRLQDRFALPVHLADERLSTREARERLDTAGRREVEDDPIAAQIILEGWLAERSAG